MSLVHLIFLFAFLASMAIEQRYLSPFRARILGAQVEYAWHSRRVSSSIFISREPGDLSRAICCGSRDAPPNMRLKLSALLSKEALCCLTFRHVRRSLSAIR